MIFATWPSRISTWRMAANQQRDAAEKRARLAHNLEALIGALDQLVQLAKRRERRPSESGENASGWSFCWPPVSRQTVWNRDGVCLLFLSLKTDMKQMHESIFDEE